MKLIVSIFLSLFCIFFVVNVTAQRKKITDCDGNEITSGVRLKIKGFPFSKTLCIEKNKVPEEFTLIPNDSSVSIIEFEINVQFEKGDYYGGNFPIKGNSFNEINFPTLKSIKGGDILYIDCPKGKKGNKIISIEHLVIVFLKE